MWGFHSAELYVTWILHGGIQPTIHQMHLFIFIMHVLAHVPMCVCVCVLLILYLSTENTKQTVTVLKP